MAGSVNKVILIGNLGADPEVRQAGSGTVAEIRVATSRSYKDRDGQEQEETEWHTVVLWNRLAELAERFLAKGRKVYVEGRLKTRSWEDQQSGQKRYKTEIIGYDLTFLDKREGGGQGDYQGRPQQQQQQRRRDQPTGFVGPKGNPYNDDNVPF
jgi:single-strand DNA-binding protein